MTARADDPRLIAPERLAEWRKWATDCDQFIAQDLLAHIDALAAENAELRARAERAEARVDRVVEEAGRAWELAAHRGAQLRDVHAAATRIAANPTAEGARELAALVLEGEK